MNIKIKEATINDVDNGLLDVFIEGYNFHKEGRGDIFLDRSDSDFRKELIENFESLSTIIILKNGIIVGYLSYQIKEKYTKKLNIEQLIISKNYRKQGLGKKLIDEAKNIAIKNNCDRIELNCWTFNSDALAMYDHIGFNRQRIIYEMKLK